MSESTLQKIAGYALLLLALLVFGSALLRYVFNWPIPDTLDFSRVLLGLSVFWGIALAASRSDQIQVDLLWDHLGPQARRLVLLLNQVLLLAFFLLFGVLVLEHVYHLYLTGKQTVDYRVPLWILYLPVLPAACLPAVLVARSMFKHRQGG